MRTHKTLLAALTAAAVLVVGCGGGDKEKTTSAATPAKRAAPSAATLADLRALENSVGHDIFWAGRKRGYTYELTKTTQGSIYIRYLPPGVPVGAGSADFLTVGTYPQRDAFATVQTAQKRPGETITKIGGGGVAVAGKDRPTSVYFSYPASKLLVEVYDPSATQAHRLVVSGKVKPLR